MSFVAALLSAGVSFLVLFAIFRPLELCFPAKTQRFFRPAFWTDLLFFLGQYLLWNGGVLWLLAKMYPYAGFIVPESLRGTVASWPFWCQVPVALFLSDLCIYWGHRIQHRIPFLWRFHAVHHSSEHLDWLAAHREHPMDTLYTIGLINLPPLLLGVNLDVIAGLVAFRGVWAIFIHSNVKLPIGPLRLLIGAPELHHWHHDRDRDAGNYANISPLMDLMFGTYRHPGVEPEAFGIREPMPKTYFGQLLAPFLSKRLRARWCR